jgi:MSHA biogenesis protein MshN
MSATRDRLERAEQARAGAPRRGNAVPAGLRPRRRAPPRALFAGIAGVAAALAVFGLLRQPPAESDPALDLAEPQRVGAGAADAAGPGPADATAHIESIALERDPSGTRLRIELDAPAQHRLEVAASGRELSLLLRGARFAREPARVDLAGTEIDWLDLRSEPPDLRVVLGLREERLVSSASYPTARGVTLVVDLLPRRDEAPPAAPLEEPEDLLPEVPMPPVKQRAALPDAAARYAAALAAERTGRLEQALAELEGVLEVRPGHAAARLRLAQLHAARGSRDRALRVLREGRALDSQRADLALLEARVLADQQQADEALAVLDGIPASARSADSHALHAALLAAQGAHARAIEAFGAALRLEPGRGAAWLGLAISLEAEKRAPEARAAYRRALGAGGIEPAARVWAEERSARLESAP